MQYTEYYNLNKPEIDDIVNINDLNDNADVLDAALHDVAAQSDIIYSKIQDTLDYLADWGKLIKNGTVQYGSGLTYVYITDLRAESFTAYSMTCNTNIDCSSLECGYFQVDRDNVSMLNQFVTVDDIHRLSPWGGSESDSLDDTLADIYSKLGSGSGINYGTSQPSGGSDKDVYFQIDLKEATDWVLFPPMPNSVHYSQWNGTYYDIETDFGVDLADYDKVRLKSWYPTTTSNDIDVSDITTSTMYVSGTSLDGYNGLRINSTTGKYEIFPNRGGDYRFEVKREEARAVKILAIWQNVRGTWINFTGGEKYEAGENINISDNVISATDTTYSDFGGTDGTTAGTSGLVPAPAVSDANKYLKSDGTWAEVQGGGGSDDHTYTTTPSEVGTWIDGRTVYEVSYSWQGSASSSEHTIVQAEPYPQSSSSAANGIVISANLFYKNTEASNGWAPIQYAIADASAAPARFIFEDAEGDSTKYNLNLYVTTPESAGKLVCIVKYVI